MGTWYLDLGVLRYAFGVRYAVSVLVTTVVSVNFLSPPDEVTPLWMTFLRYTTVLGPKNSGQLAQKGPTQSVEHLFLDGFLNYVDHSLVVPGFKQS